MWTVGEDVGVEGAVKRCAECDGVGDTQRDAVCEVAPIEGTDTVGLFLWGVETPAENVGSEEDDVEKNEPAFVCPEAAQAGVPREYFPLLIHRS